MWAHLSTALIVAFMLFFLLDLVFDDWSIRKELSQQAELHEVQVLSVLSLMNSSHSLGFLDITHKYSHFLCEDHRCLLSVSCAIVQWGGVCFSLHSFVETGQQLLFYKVTVIMSYVSLIEVNLGP